MLECDCAIRSEVTPSPSRLLYLCYKGELQAGKACTAQSSSSVRCGNFICQIVTLINEVMTNLTLLELGAIAVVLDEEDAESNRRRWAVHPAWSKRDIEGEFVTLYKELIDYEVKFYGCFRLNTEFFCRTREIEPITYKTTNEISKAYIS